MLTFCSLYCKNYIWITFIQLYVLFNSVYCVKGQLTVNVLNKGGEITRETIVGNITLDTIHLDFEKYDGTLVKQFIDFKNDIQIFRVIIPPDQDITNDKSVILCFITLLLKDSFISPDAMSKLRQKNPGATRVPELTLPLRHHDFDSRVYDIHSDAALSISENLPSICGRSLFDSSANIDVSTYMRLDDVKTLSSGIGSKNYQLMESALKQRLLDRQEPPKLCTNTSSNQESLSSCICIYRVIIGWYPCGLKYCKGRDNLGKPINYRCGIKTCSISHRFNYVTEKKTCVTDDP